MKFSRLCTHIVFLLSVIVLTGIPGTSQALFTVPEEDLVEEKEGVDLAKEYSVYTPTTLKIKTPEDKQDLLEGKNASINLNRNRRTPITVLKRKKANTRAPIANLNKNKVSPVTHYIFLSLLSGLVILLWAYVFILKMRSMENEK